MQDCSVEKAARKSDRDSNLLLNIRPPFHIYKYSRYLHKIQILFGKLSLFGVIKV